MFFNPFKRKYCIDCNFYRDGWCERPDMSNLVDGPVTPIGTLCSYERNSDLSTSCGYNGKFWKPKTEIKGAEVSHD